MAQVIIISDVTRSGDEFGVSRSIGPYVLASKLRSAGFSTLVIDKFVTRPSLKNILTQAIGPETLLVGVSSTFLSLTLSQEELSVTHTQDYYSGYLWCRTREELQEFLADVRALINTRSSGAKGAKIALGGAKAILGLQQSDMRTLFDFYVVGKAESFIVELVSQLHEDREIPFRYFEGTPYLHEMSYGATTETIETISWEKSDAIQPGEGLPLEIAKGCLYNCKFCHFEKQGSIRQTAENLREQLTRNFELFGTTTYHFCDDCFNDTRGKVESICSVILALPFKIDWVSYARVDVAVKFPETLDMMVESGGRGFYWGLESFDHKVGRSIGKGTDPELVKAMLIRLKEQYGDRVLSTGSFIVGLPGETEESVWRTNQWILESRVLDDVAYSVLGLRPYSERLDKAVVDYADFSRHPEKYGFKSISFAPNYWAHQTMDLPYAIELKARLLRNLYNNGMMKSFAQSIFQYPYFRSLGLTHDDVVALYRNHTWGDSRYHELVALDREWQNRYEGDLLERLRGEAQGRAASTPGIP